MSDLQAAQRESERQRRHLVNLAQEWHTATEANVAGVFAEYRDTVPNLTDSEREAWWQRLTTAAELVQRLLDEHENTWHHLAKRASGEELPHAHDGLDRAAYGALIADGNAALAKARGAS